MSTETEDGTSGSTYELTCTDCTYETTVSGTVHDALDAAQAHQDEHGRRSMRHFVDFELVDGTA